MNVHTNADVEALIKNQRPSKKKICNGYRPAFLISPDYLTTGELAFVNCDYLDYGEEALAEIKFLTPYAYPHTLEEGQIISFQEGSIINGYAKIIRIKNPLLKKDKQPVL